MERELYKELTLNDIDKELEFFGLSEETRAKVMKWAEKKLLQIILKESGDLYNGKRAK